MTDGLDPIAVELLGNIDDLIREAGATPDADSEPGVRWISYPTPSGDMPLRFDVTWGGGLLTVHSLFPRRADGDTIWPIVEVATRINAAELPVGNFEVDVEHGTIRCKTSADVTGTSGYRAAIGNLVTANVAVTSRFLPVFTAVLDGTDVDDAFQLLA